MSMTSSSHVDFYRSILHVIRSISDESKLYLTKSGQVTQEADKQGTIQDIFNLCLKQSQRPCYNPKLNPLVINGLHTILSTKCDSVVAHIFEKVMQGYFQTSDDKNIMSMLFYHNMAITENCLEDYFFLLLEELKVAEQKLVHYKSLIDPEIGAYFLTTNSQTRSFCINKLLSLRPQTAYGEILYRLLQNHELHEKTISLDTHLSSLDKPVYYNIKRILTFADDMFLEKMKLENPESTASYEEIHYFCKQLKYFLSLYFYGKKVDFLASGMKTHISEYKRWLHKERPLADSASQGFSYSWKMFQLMERSVSEGLIESKQFLDLIAEYKKAKREPFLKHLDGLSEYFKKFRHEILLHKDHKSLESLLLRSLLNFDVKCASWLDKSFIESPKVTPKSSKAWLDECQRIKSLIIDSSESSFLDISGNYLPKLLKEIRKTAPKKHVAPDEIFYDSDFEDAGQKIKLEHEVIKDLAHTQEILKKQEVSRHTLGTLVSKKPFEFSYDRRVKLWFENPISYLESDEYCSQSAFEQKKQTIFHSFSPLVDELLNSDYCHKTTWHHPVKNKTYDYYLIAGTYSFDGMHFEGWFEYCFYKEFEAKKEKYVCHHRFFRVKKESQRLGDFVKMPLLDYKTSFPTLSEALKTKEVYNCHLANDFETDTCDIKVTVEAVGRITFADLKHSGQISVLKLA